MKPHFWLLFASIWTQQGYSYDQITILTTYVGKCKNSVFFVDKAAIVVCTENNRYMQSNPVNCIPDNRIVHFMTWRSLAQTTVSRLLRNNSVNYVAVFCIFAYLNRNWMAFCPIKRIMQQTLTTKAWLSERKQTVSMRK